MGRNREEITIRHQEGSGGHQSGALPFAAAIIVPGADAHLAIAKSTLGKSNTKATASQKCRDECA